MIHIAAGNGWRTQMQRNYLAVDIGASGGRHILGTVSEGKLKLEEIYRFENGPKHRNGHLCWDLNRLFGEIKAGLKECAKKAIVPVSLGIDTWGVDYVLLDEENRILGDSFSYRDHRTDGMDLRVEEILTFEELYERTGIQKQIFNTIYQLMAVKVNTPELMGQASDLLMLPDYFHYLLTGIKRQEYTNATTTQLVHARNKVWDYELIDRLGLKKELFRPLSLPMSSVGYLIEEVAGEVGFTCEVVLPATHDTGSAVLSIPAQDEDFIFISSGTWSLMGILRDEADCSPVGRLHNFTNEGGLGYRFRYLKNIMGLWMLQSVRHEEKDAYSFSELCDLARTCDTFPSRVNVNDPRFLSPENMTEAIIGYLRESGQKEPVSIGELAACIYQSLADSYAETVKEIETITGRSYPRLHIIGGGANAGYLNELTAKATGKRVYAGPIEATAVGNLIAQMLKSGEFTSLKEAGYCILRSFDIQEVLP